MRRIIMLTFVAASTLVFVNSASADEATEKKKIEALIKHIEEVKDAKFVRNGRENEPKKWAAYMRVKWDRAEAEVKTAKDFIDKCASTSSVSGKPYLVKFKDGKEQKLGDFLTAELKKLEKPEEKKSDDKKQEQKQPGEKNPTEKK